MSWKIFSHGIGILLLFGSAGCGAPRSESEFGTLPKEGSEFVLDTTLESKLISLNGLSRTRCLTELAAALSAATLRSGVEKMAQSLDEKLEIEVTTFCKINKR